MEPVTIKHLADAAAALQAAKKATAWGFVSDHCETALREVQKALRIAATSDDQDDPE